MREYSVRYHSGISHDNLSVHHDAASRGFEMKAVASGALEYWNDDLGYANDGKTVLDSNQFVFPNHTFAGWTIRFRVNSTWYWYLEDGTIAPTDTKNRPLMDRRALLSDGSKIPFIPVDQINVAVLVAHWHDRDGKTASGSPRTSQSVTPAGTDPFRVLLLTNRDSDNVGDQIIEASALSLIRAVMKNLDVPKSKYSISSRAAGIIPKTYLATREPHLIDSARKSISNSDVVLFGGAPLFNYAYQNFYLRTIKTVELAQEYNVPVLFSSIGVEPYSATNKKSQALKAALGLPVVKQITTRDDIASLRQYVEGTHVPVDLVADPAVVADIVFRNTASTVKPMPENGSKGVIGLVVTRAGLAIDNKIDFTEEDQRNFWRKTIALLTERGYDYKLFTTGHFSDEVFLDAWVRADAIPMSKVAVTVNSPDELLAQLRACNGIIAYRLHASITSFALGIPSIGLSWNFKVPDFYASVGLRHRALAPEDWKAEIAVDALERAIDEGVPKDEEFLMSVYRTLFDGLRPLVAPECENAPYSYEQLKTNLPAYAGTSEAQYREKITRKMRRTYETYFKRTQA